MPSKYRITREEYHNEYGLGTGPDFFVQKLSRIFFFWHKWEYIRHEECGLHDCRKVRTKFKNKKEAKDFIEEILVKKKEVGTHSHYVIGEYNYDN